MPASSVDCERTCPGRAAPGMQALVTEKVRPAKACYERMLRSRQRVDGGVPRKSSGNMVIRFRLFEEGSVGCTRVVTDEIGEPGLVACVIDLLRSSDFTSTLPAAGCVDAAAPLHFPPSPAAGASKP
jgi:hypothetical protein